MPAYADAVTGQVIGQTDEGLTGPQKHVVSPVEVVITGMSGRFPESNSIGEFAKNLYDGVDMITEDARRWTPGFHGLPTRSGKLPDLSHFDSSFFSVSPRQAHTMDPQLRLLLELTYEAIVDAGLTPNDLRGRRVGVYIGVSQSESEEAWTRDPSQITGYGLTGCCRAMFPNRISYTFDFKGPSYAVDTACSSSMVALQAAWAAMQQGEIEAAIVGGSNLTLKPETSMQFNALNMLAVDGKCKAFDASGNGYVRSEAVSVILLQTPSAAQRVYAHLVHAATNTDGNKNEGVTFPSGAVQKQLLLQVYKAAGVSPKDVSYVEAHGTGTKVGDPQEVNAIADVFCKGRSTPLLMGSVKSNMGHSEPASGLCSIVKVLIAMQRQEIPGNLHFKSPNTEIPALNDGKIKVVSKNTPWTGGYAAINSFGFGGANVHILLKSYQRNLPAKPASNRDTSIMRALSTSTNKVNHQKDGIIPKLVIPRIVLASGRTPEAVKTLLNGVTERATPALYSIMDRLSRNTINNHPHRGYILASSDTALAQENRIPSSKNPLYLIFSGMGSQWPACGRRLLDIPVFAKAIKRCEAALAPHGFDLMKVLTSEETNTKTVEAFSAIAAVQVGLTDVLRSVGLEFDGVVGHSVGELGCAYAVGALTAEQTVLSAYWRGRAVQEAKMPPGAMAAVGLGAEDALKYCRDGVVVACHNSKQSVTISGPKEAVNSIVEKLTAEGIFARAVQSEGIAFHHPNLQAAAPRLLKELTNTIPHPVSRGSKWLSSSVPESEWDTPRAKMASPQYLVSNLLSSVLFAEAIEKLPSEATLVEVSPHGLLQAILKRSMPEATYIPLIRKDTKDTVAHLLESLGKIYMSGEQLNIGVLYPAAPSPVPLSTPSLADLIRWDHNVEWDVASFSSSSGSSEFQVKIDLDTDEDAYIEGHTIDGRVIFPATGYMVLAWRALCLLTGQKWEETPVTFNNITLHQATVLASSATSRNTVTFTVRILLAKGEFEIVVGDSVAASGQIQVGVTDKKEKAYLNSLIQKGVSNVTEANEMNLKKQDVYKELRLRGYHYGGLFQGITEADLKGSSGNLLWQDNWVSFLDTLLQFSLLSAKSRGLMLPTRIRKVAVDPEAFLKSFAQTGESNDKGVKVWHNTNIGVTVCNGIFIEGMKATLAPRRPVQDRPLLEHYTFVPLTLTKAHPILKQLSKEDAITILTSLVVENSKSLKLKIIEDLSDISATSEKNEVVNITRTLETHPTLGVDCTLLTSQKPNEEEEELFNSLNINVKNTTLENALSSPPHLLVLHQNMKQELISKLDDDTFVLVDNQDVAKQLLVESFIHIASIESFNLILLRKKRSPSNNNEVLKVEGNGFEWVETLKSKMSEDKDTPFWLLSVNQGISGLLGMTNCARREPGGGRIRCLMSMECEQTVNEELVSRDLVINVYQNGSWGTYRHLPLPEPKPEATSNALLNVANRGDLASLTWFQMPPVEDDLKYPEILCHVNYAPLNFRDVMLATGKLPPDALPGDLAMKECILGLEFVGTNNGERVMGLISAGGLATAVKGDPLLTWKVPKAWKMQEAATVPVVYATAYYALVLRGGLKSGETVLIHAGSGGVGQAAISIALARGCTVYTTVSSKEKRMVLQKRFPKLKEENFANSRDGSFEYDILERTGGRGVDIVLNSLAGDLLQASVRCLKEHGRFLEIGKADLASNSALGMAIFLKNVTFHGILLDSLFDGPTDKRQQLNKIVADGLINGEVSPLPYTAFSRDQAEEAFRFMATGKHIGKVVLEVCPEGKENIPSARTVEAMPRINAKPHMVYVLTGGLGGLGLELADWLIVRGATKLVLTSRRGVTTGYQALRVKKWREQGVNVNVLCQDSSTIAGAEKLLKEAGKMGPIGGIFHLAMILKDSMLENQSAELFTLVNTVKGDGAVAMDVVSRRLCPELHIWVTFSSVACGKGNAGQTNYGWANSVSERVVESRIAAGLPGVAIQWGGIGDVGVLAETLGDVEVGGTKPQSVRSVLECLDRLLQGNNTIVSSVCLASKNKGSKSGGASLVKAIANVLGVKDMSTAPMEVSLGDLGLDSLMSVEVKNILEREKAIVFSTAQVRELTLKRLQEIEKNGGEDGSNANASQPEKTSHDQSKSESQIVMKYPSHSLPLIPEVSIKLLKEKGTLSPLFIASQIHGSADPLLEVVKGLDRKVYGMQYSADIPHSSVRDMTQALAQRVMKTEPTGDLTIGGYSFGTAVAIEMTTILKTMGRNVNSVVLLDGSQSYVSGLIQGHTSRHSSTPSKHPDNKERVQNESDGLVFYALQFADVEAAALSKSLMALSSWEKRLNLVAEVVVQNRTKHSSPDSVPDQKMVKQAKLAAQLFYQRLEAGFQHECKKSVDCPVLLIKARDNLQARALGADYGLKKIVNGSLEVLEVPGTHESFITRESGKKVTEYLNNFLKH